MRAFLILPALVSLVACAEVGQRHGTSAAFGAATRTNDLAQMASNQRSRYLVDAAVRFSAEAPDTVEFAFGRANLSARARSALDAQAAWLAANPDIRMSVVGHTDLVGGESYNDKLGLRRAQAVARYLLARGVGQGRVEAVETRGEREPLVSEEGPQPRNRRAVTFVAGYTHGFVGDGDDGRRARLIYRRYATDSVEAPESAAGTTD